MNGAVRRVRGGCLQRWDPHGSGKRCRLRHDCRTVSGSRSRRRRGEETRVTEKYSFCAAALAPLREELFTLRSATYFLVFTYLITQYCHNSPINLKNQSKPSHNSILEVMKRQIAHSMSFDFKLLYSLNTQMFDTFKLQIPVLLKWLTLVNSFSMLE